MDKTISLVQSRTFWGAMVSLSASLASFLGLPEDAKIIADPATLTAILNLIGALGAAVAIVGRLIAAAKVTSILPKGGAGPIASAIVPMALLVLAMASLSACQTMKPAAPISTAAIQENAKTALTTFCDTGLPAAQPFAQGLNAQMQRNYATVSRACADIGNGRAVNPVTAVWAALDLYEGVKATYPQAFKALAPADVARLVRVRQDWARYAGAPAFAR